MKPPTPAERLTIMMNAESWTPPRGPLTKALADALGEAGLHRLVAVYGGQRLRVHSQPQPASAMAQALGPALYADLQREFFGEELDIPRLMRESWAARDARIRARAAAGETANQIAAAEGLYLRRVREILARAAPPPPPPSATP